MSGNTVVSVCPICSSSEVVHLCSAVLEAKTVIDKARMEQKDNKSDGKSEVSGMTTVNDRGDHKLEDRSSSVTSVVKNSVHSPVSDLRVSDLHISVSDSSVSETPEMVNEDYQKYVVIYLGSSYLDRRFPPQTAMPWVMGEVKRSRDTFKEVQLQIRKGTLNAVAYEGTEQIETVFEHNLHTLSRFAKTHQDPRCFAYLRRQSLYSDYECHVFLANDENVVSLLYFLHSSLYCNIQLSSTNKTYTLQTYKMWS